MMRHPSHDGDTLRLHDGRLVCFRIYGQPGGRPLYFFHGFPGSHLQAALVHAQAAAAGIALVAFDRPGFGASSADPRATIASIAADVADLADHLGHRRFGVVGVSCGGPHALGCARWLPRRVTAVGLLAGIAPMGAAHRPQRHVIAGRHRGAGACRPERPRPPCAAGDGAFSGRHVAARAVPFLRR